MERIRLAGLSAAFALAGCATAPVPQLPPDIARLTATEIAAGVCRGAFTSEAVTRAYLARARERAGHHAFITLDEDGALQAARQVDARRAAGAPCLPLLGVPVAVKDNIEVAGLPTTAGTPALRAFVPATDAPVVQRLRAAGAVVLGKTNMHELAFGISGYNPAYTPPDRVGVRNAWDIARMAGGSSSGSGVALGARMAPAALGTDTGGSVRIPCALNGCASLRPTVGRYPLAGIAPISHTRDTAGPMAVAMGDVDLLDRVITGAPASAPADLRGVRLGLAPEFLRNLDADTQAAFDDALARLRAAGVTIAPVTLPGLGDLNGGVSFPVALYEAYDDMAAWLRGSGAGITIEQMVPQIASPDVKGTYQGLVLPRLLPTPDGRTTPAAPVYQAAMANGRPALMRLYASTFGEHRLDALVFPTVPHTAPLANPESSSLETFLLFIQNTDPGSNAGIPGIQLPIALGATSRLPVGMELDGPAGSDRRLLAIGRALEALLGRLPPAP
jgi:mandelamide amidase